jgi:hypothetical protein
MYESENMFESDALEELGRAIGCEVAAMRTIYSIK